MKRNPKKRKGVYDLFQIEGIGTVEYNIGDDRDSQINLRVQDFYVTQFSRNLRIIPPQRVKTVEGHKATFKAHRNMAEPGTYAELEIKEDQLGQKNKPPIQTIIFPYHPIINMTIIGTKVTGHKKQTSKDFHSSVCVMYENNKKLAPAHKKLPKCHFKLGHTGFQNV